jgi:hypothetical protein
LTVVYAPQSEAPGKASTISLLPLLVVLFIVSYAILTLLVVEQGRTIEAQRSLVREMLKDSTQLAALKGKLASEAKQSQDKAAAEAEEKEPGSGNSTATPKRHDKDPKRPGQSARPHKVIPQKPAADLEDVRRSTRAI